MRTYRPGKMGAPWTATVTPLAFVCGLAAFGCAHHRADQYAFAPPYAPPVYSQPQVQMPAQPTAYAAAPGGFSAGAVPVGTVPMGTAPTASLPIGTAAAGPTMPAGTVVTAAGGECPPCTTPGMEGVVMPATMIEDGGHTPPCPPGP